MNEIVLKYDKEEVNLQLPADLQVKHLSPSFPEDYQLINEEEVIKSALERPISSRNLSDIAKDLSNVLIIVPDKTRFSGVDKYLPFIIQELLDAGINSSNIDILFANGSHSLQTNDEVKRILGRCYEHPNVFQHDYDNKASLKHYGETKFGTPIYLNTLYEQNELIILTGNIHYHYFAGFSGGIKSLIPGIAGRVTIKHNHSLTIKGDFEYLNPNCDLGQMEENPLQLDLRDALKFVNKRLFLFNTILDDKDRIINAFSGDVLEAHLPGCKSVQQYYSVPVEQKADLVIASAGGYPKDINIIQAHKSIHNAFQALKPGGKMLILAKCSQGIGSKTFIDWFKFKDVNLTKEKMLEKYSLNAQTALSTIIKNQTADIYLYSDLNKDLLSHMGFKLVNTTIQETLNDIINSFPSLPTTYIIPKASLVVPISE